MVKPIRSNSNYKVRVTYGNKTTKTMVLTGKQIKERRSMDEKAKEKSSRYKPYIKITVLEQLKPITVNMGGDIGNITLKTKKEKDEFFAMMRL